MDFEKDFGKIMENVRKYRDIIKLITTERRRNHLASELNCNTTKFLTEHLIAIETTEMKKAQIRINKPVYLRLSVLE